MHIVKEGSPEYYSDFLFLFVVSCGFKSNENFYLCK